MSHASGVPAVVTGVGPVSAIGCGRNEFWEALVSGRSGVGPITRCGTSAAPSRVGAEVKDFHLERYVLERDVERGDVMVGARAGTPASSRPASSSARSRPHGRFPPLSDLT